MWMMWIHRLPIFCMVKCEAYNKIYFEFQLLKAYSSELVYAKRRFNELILVQNFFII
jgi:hypothetical protein